MKKRKRAKSWCWRMTRTAANSIRQSPCGSPSSGGPMPANRRSSIGCLAKIACWSGRKPASPAIPSASISSGARARQSSGGLKIFDTAGLRRRARIDDKLEKLAAADALRAVRFAEVVVILLDATIPFEKQDLTITDLAAREGRALVIGVNKWDLIADKPRKNHRVARGGRTPAAAGARDSGRAGVGRDGAGARRADRGDPACA